jgi:hypothetical protein
MTNPDIRRKVDALMEMIQNCTPERRERAMNDYIAEEILVNASDAVDYNINDVETEKWVRWFRHANRAMGNFLTWFGQNPNANATEINGEINELIRQLGLPLRISQSVKKALRRAAPLQIFQTLMLKG